MKTTLVNCMTWKNPRKTMRAVSFSGAALSLLFYTAPAVAQPLDYQSFETLFGEPVTTSVTGSPQRSSKVPATMEIITAEDIRRSGARDIPAILRHVVGMDVMQWSNDQADVGVRGYDQAYTPRLLVLIDGRQVYSDHYGYTPWSTLPIELSDIRQIEIVKGPNSALFGFNAVGGVINIITFSPRDGQADSASLTGGTQGELRGSLLKSWKIAEKSAIRLSAGYSRDDGYTTPIPLAMFSSQRQSNYKGQIGVNGIFQLTDSVQLGLEANHSEVRQNEVNPSYTFGTSRYTTNSVRMQLGADTDVGLVQLTAYSNWLEQKSRNTFLGDFDFKNHVTVAQLQDVVAIGTASTLRLSAEYRHNELPTTPVTGGKIAYDVYSPSGMWQWNIARDISWTNAIRLDILDLGRTGSVPAGYPLANDAWERSRTEYTFNSGIVWTASETDTLRLLVGRGVQAPSLAVLGSLLAVTPFVNFTGLPSIKPATVMNYEIGWDRILPMISGKARASIFHQDSSDLISISGSGTGMPGVYLGPANIGSSAANGMEFEIDGGLPENWRWSVNYRYEAVRDHFIASVANGLGGADYQHVTPKHLANASLGWSGGGWEVDGFARFQSATRGLQPNLNGIGYVLTPVEAYVSADARIAYRLTETVTLAISGQNLLQSSQRQTSGPAVQRGVFATFSKTL